MEKVEINRVRIRLDRLSSPALCCNIFDVFSNSEVESVGNSWDFSLCVFVVPLSDVNVFLGLFSQARILNLLSRRPFSLSLSRKKSEASVALLCE